ncbi:MAG: ligase-associated DNA damage response endonuclease PdeM [Chitinophagia bacterium]|nr:ligase-associated DNA damage response endonuclease PdeM [Chitinophagia bacterium]
MKYLRAFIFIDLDLEIQNIHFKLLTQRALYLPDEELLVIADLHLGKRSQNKKNGVLMPITTQDTDYSRLDSLLSEIMPAKVLFLGDLLNSKVNNDAAKLAKVLWKHQHISFELVRGNNDIIDDTQYRKIGIKVVHQFWLKKIHFTHEPYESKVNGVFNVAGYMHPGYVLRGSGTQEVTLPIFYYTPVHLIMPSFGATSGLFLMRKTGKSSIFLVSQKEITTLVK